MSKAENWDCERDKAAGLTSCRVSEGFVGLSLDGVPVLGVASLRVLVLAAAKVGTVAVLGLLSSCFQSRPQKPPQRRLV